MVWKMLAHPWPQKVRIRCWIWCPRNVSHDSTRNRITRIGWKNSQNVSRRQNLHDRSFQTFMEQKCTPIRYCTCDGTWFRSLARRWNSGNDWKRRCYIQRKKCPINDFYDFLPQRSSLRSAIWGLSTIASKQNCCHLTRSSKNSGKQVVIFQRTIAQSLPKRQDQRTQSCNRIVVLLLLNWSI